MRLPSVMGHSFSQVPQADIQRSQFDRSHGYKTTFDAGYLIPFFVDEALPGDTMSMNVSAFSRLATPIHPFMDNMFMSTFFFAVPYRLVWDNWEKFNGSQDNPADSTDFLIPQMQGPATTGWTSGSLGDYFGIPTGVADIKTSALWFRAYNLIWNEWFRDQNLQDSVVVDKDDGPDVDTDYVVLRRGKRHDYFTSCLPWPQKGPAVSFPIGGLAPVVGIGFQSTAVRGPTQDVYETDQVGTTNYSGTYNFAQDPGRAHVDWDDTDGYPSSPNVYADLDRVSSATGTINALRQAFQIQKILERDARSGTRYTEVIHAHFGVRSPDARLQRPEYLGGGISPVLTYQVEQTSESATTPQGNLAAYGTAMLSGSHGFSKSFTEHCLLIGLVSVRADLTYQQGLDRMWSRLTRYDYYWPALSHIGEQAVLSQEIFVDGTNADQDVFGYQERYGEYRYKPSKITGKFRSADAQSLDTWHLSQDFANRPVLNAEFIEDDPPVERVIAVATEPHFLFDAWLGYRCARPMPVYGVPGLIDHF